MTRKLYYYDMKIPISEKAPLWGAKTQYEVFDIVDATVESRPIEDDPFAALLEPRHVDIVEAQLGESRLIKGCGIKINGDALSTKFANLFDLTLILSQWAEEQLVGIRSIEEGGVHCINMISEEVLEIQNTDPACDIVGVLNITSWTMVTEE